MPVKIKIYNSLTRKKEIFKEIKEGRVGIYSCGPTVYNYVHIGNLRSFVTSDIIKRMFLFNDYKVKHIMNITDVDDKTIKGSKKENLSLEEFTRKYEKIFLNDTKEMNIILPEVMPRATESINEMVNLIKILLKKKYAYKAEDGIYFSIDKFKDYRKLANLKKSRKQKSRIKNDEYDKENLQDFSLWKFYDKEDGYVFWETEIGKGRPGWHIECSAMSIKYLGIPFDIHTGGTDLIFPHHTNEIAQSEAVFNKKFVNYWMHGGFLTMKEGKMSKSLGNVYTLNDLKKEGFSPLDYRYFCLTSQYRKQLNFSFENLENAKRSYQRLKNIISEIREDNKINKEYLKEFKKKINNDLDTANALKILWCLVRDKKAQGKYKTIAEMDKVFGLELLKEKKIEEIPEKIKNLIDERTKARKEKNWNLSDKLRDKIKELGYWIDDTTEGQKIKRL